MTDNNGPTTPRQQQNKTTQRLEVFKVYPEADFNDAWYPVMNQVRRAGKENPAGGKNVKFKPVVGATKPHRERNSASQPKRLDGKSQANRGDQE